MSFQKVGNFGTRIPHWNYTCEERQKSFSLFIRGKNLHLYPVHDERKKASFVATVLQIVEKS